MKKLPNKENKIIKPRKDLSKGCKKISNFNLHSNFEKSQMIISDGAYVILADACSAQNSSYL